MIQAAAGKPIILVLVNGGALGIENLVAMQGTCARYRSGGGEIMLGLVHKILFWPCVRPGIQAIIEGFYPSLRGAEAIARTIFGQYNKYVNAILLAPSAFSPCDPPASFFLTGVLFRTH